MKTNAYMLRQDGKYWSLPVHIYVEDDEDLSSAAEAASFIIFSDSKDKDYAEYVLDAWMALLLEYVIPYDADNSTIDELIPEVTSKVGYKFPFDVSSKYVSIHDSQDNYHDVDTLYEFVDKVKEDCQEINDTIRKSLNQQFCRVRYGGQYDTASYNNSLWFRISSVGYNWANTIYIFVSDHYRGLHVSNIFICRDYESDNGDDETASEYFYKAKDGVPYYNMPIDDYLVEEHEHSPVFSSSAIGSGIIHSIKVDMSNGKTYLDCQKRMIKDDIVLGDRSWNVIKNQEIRNCCINASYLEDTNIRTKNKLYRVINRIERVYPEIQSIDVTDVKPRANRNGNMTAAEVIFHIRNDYDKLDDIDVGVICMRGLQDATEDVLFRGFKNEYEPYKAAVLV